MTGYVNDGVAGTGSTDQAYIGDASGSTLVPLPTGAYYSVGYAINGSGQVSGYVAGIFSSGIGWAQAFIGSASGSATIPVPQGCSGCVYGLALNDSGEVVGNDLVGQSFEGTAQGSSLFSSPAGWSDQYAYAINSSGQVAGYLWNGSLGQACVSSGSSITVIPLPTGGTSDYFVDLANPGMLNDSSVVVGESDSGGVGVGPDGWTDPSQQRRSIRVGY